MSRIKPTHGMERMIFNMLEQGSVAFAIAACAARYRDKYNRKPTCVFVNQLLQRALEEEMYPTSRYGWQLPIPSQQISWFYNNPVHATRLPDAQWIIVCEAGMVSTAETL